MDADPPKYWAFISYSHRDSKVAAALQHALETYRLPSTIVGRRTPLGEVPAFLKPVFRDRDELQAGADLKATVREALAQSRYLIVVCSPDAARSQWVNREIVEFKQIHGEARVLALIAGGEPFASRMPGREADECFPEALRFALTPDGQPHGEALEPIAADLRPQGDGKRLATLKLVAGMVGAGVGLDELVRRDAQRRVRRMAAIAAVSIAGMAAMAVLTVMAIQARTEAQSQRAQAEDLVEFMLGDLRRKLEPVGRLDVLDAVGEKALAYYAKQQTDRLDANALGRRSRALHLIGEMREKRGRLDDALAAFRSAADTTSESLAQAPNDAQRIFDHAQSVYWVGYIAWRRGQAQAAADAFLKYRDLAQQLVRIDAANADWQLETAYASQNLGVVELERRRLPDALKAFSEARDVLTRVVATRPGAAFELADAHGWIAKVSEAAGDYDGSIAAQQARLDVLHSMPDAAKDARVHSQTANANYELARLQLYLGDLSTAERHARVAVVQAEQLVATDTTNMFALSELCFDRLRLAEVERAQGRLDDARASVDRASDEASRLIASDASMVNWQVNLRGLLLAAVARSALVEARAFPYDPLGDYLRKVGQMEKSGKQLTSAQLEIVAGVELIAGDILHGEDRDDEARKHWAATIERLQSESGDDNYPVQTMLARARLRLGNTADARTARARIEASKFRHPAYADLVNELAPGAGPGLSIARTRGN